MYIGGLDIGTTGCKISIYNEKGSFICRHYQEYSSVRNADRQEIDGNEVWESVQSVLKSAAEEVGKIDAIGVTSFGESFVLLDAEDNILLPSMLYTDKRGNEECSVFDPEFIAQTAGVKPHGMFSLPKLMWIKKNLPEIYEKAVHVLLYEDFIIYKLTGNPQIDYSLACRTMAFDVKNRCWSKEIFDQAGIDVNKMSTPVCCGTSAGEATLDCIKGAVIVNGCHDQLAAVIGAGVMEEHTAVDGTGTVECITPVFRSIPAEDTFYGYGYSIEPHIFSDAYVCPAFSFTGGAALKWYRDTFLPDASYAELDASVGDEPTGILIMPHFAGAATPFMDENSKAVFCGVTLATTKEDLYRAIMEGVTYEMMLNIEKLEEAGIHIDTLYATGGGANSSVWLQIKADALGKEITALDAPEVGAQGTVMLAAAAIGAVKDLNEAVEVFVKKGKTYIPNPENTAKYQALYEKYKKIYSATLELR